MAYDIVIIDGNFICTAAKHMDKRMNAQHPGTFILFAVMKKILPIVESFSPIVTAWVWDSRVSFRREIYPDYKHKRAKAKKEKSEDDKKIDRLAIEQLNEIRDVVLPYIGCQNSFLQEGVEGDDLIAKICEDYSGKKVFLTSDHDLFQCISDDAHMFDPIRKELITPRSFFKKWGVHPRIWGDVKCIAGCGSDDVPGVPGVAEKTAVKYLTCNLKLSTAAYQKITDHKDVISRNKLLVTLPFYKTQPVKLCVPDQIKLKDFADILRVYNIRSLLTTFQLTRFEKAFRMV
jgi:DNA polymerase-1